jgi:cytoskeletal protein RodZ
MAGEAPNMPALEIAQLLRDYGMVGALALALFVIGILTKWWREAIQQRIDDKDKMTERIAVALERSSSTSVDQTEAIKEMREGQGTILKTVTEAALTGAAKDNSILDKIGELRSAVDRNTGARP